MYFTFIVYMEYDFTITQLKLHNILIVNGPSYFTL
jgi:hypothetical protein